MNSIFNTIADRAKMTSIRCGRPYRPTASRPESAADGFAYGPRRIRTALQLIAASTAIALSAPAFAATAEQCKTITDAYVQTLKYQLNGVEQARMLLQQNLAILASIVRLKMLYPDLKDADLESLRNIAARVNEAGHALDPEGDPDMQKNAVLVLRELCP
jgi:hypothetical protein